MNFIRQARFHLLFSADSPLGERQLGVDVPASFEELDIGTPISDQRQPPGCLHTPTVRSLGIVRSVVGFTPSILKAMSPRLPESSTNVFFELSGDHGAAPVTRYQTYRVNSPLESAFKAYAKRHYESWVMFARNKQYRNDVQPVLISGFDMTRDINCICF